MAVLLVASVGLAGPLVAACSSDTNSKAAPEEEGLAGAVRTPPLQVEGLSLPNVADGKPMKFVAPTGGLLLVYFGYTSCPDVCPTTLSDISVGLKELPKTLAERVTVAVATLDPDRDSPKIMTGYLETFFHGIPGIHTVALRTEDPAELTSVTDGFGVQFEVEDHAPGRTEYGVSHSAITYVVDDTGTVVVEWPFGLRGLDMAKDLKVLLTKEKK